MFRYRHFILATCLALVGIPLAAAAARAQSFAGICAGTSQESSTQCLALKAADEDLKKAVAAVPTPGYTMGPEVSVAA
ncbi:MAG: hypothetical protein AB7M05_19585, partial [Alphaproteobacteria bacterium]